MLKNNLTKINSNLFVYEPFIVSKYNGDKITNISRYIYIQQVKYLIKVMKLTEPILWVLRDRDAELINCFDSNFKIYTLGDLSSVGYEGNWLKRVDALITFSKPLFEQYYNSYKGKIFLIPTCCDYELFSKVYESKENKIPLDLKDIKRPIIGFVGNVTKDRIDFELLEFLASNNQEFSFVFIGPVSIIPSFNFKNIFLLGSKPRNIVPWYIKYFDVGIIPYLQNEFNRNCNPMKLDEYFSMGKPVVSTYLPSLKEFEGPVLLCKTKEEFNKSLKTALNDSRQEEKLKIAQKHDIKNIVEMIDNFIYEKRR